MKLLLLGADGQVGFELRRSLLGLGHVRACTRTEADLSQHDALAALIAAERPDWIINAAAYTAVDRAEDQPELAHQINGEALSVIGASAKAIGARVLHYSTDYVFAGTEPGARQVSDACAPIGVYGASKLAGERALQVSGAPHLILRTAWVFAARGKNFLRTMLRLGAEQEQLRVVADQHGTPTSARLIAQVSALMIAALRTAPANDLRFGAYHVTAAGQTTWHGFATALLQAAVARGLMARMPEVLAIRSDAFPTKAKRPHYSVLDCKKLEMNFGLQLPAWQVPMELVLDELKDRNTA
ncbi:dTDP-4-dehydrorhamnose reductase [Ahniella affigens]|uniref:dTDP-4-dehydrorhamnose reductase n=1 Tax=Ahniella affigens TaxID=2021234 RepID=A0A2P1PUH9_9GAMM|nr:dTDP-4-dehydrorhamnose reductase [Ahniella affigens]AVP98494.1 dTDP-4-dehydrorhamnose reductase [Ahniella affigens]